MRRATSPPMLWPINITFLWSGYALSTGIGIFSRSNHANETESLGPVFGQQSGRSNGEVGRKRVIAPGNRDPIGVQRIFQMIPGNSYPVRRQDYEYGRRRPQKHATRPKPLGNSLMHSTGRQPVLTRDISPCLC